jgi:butyrate kinase
MIGDLVHSPREHASNLGGLLAREIADRAGVGAYIADPVVVDELDDVVRITGIPEIRRVSIFHPLNQKAVARRYAASIGKRYEDLNLIVAHMGGGISIGAHLRGRVVDVNNALGGEGPFTPERAGSLPGEALAELCFSGKYTLPEVKRMLIGEGGLLALLGTNSVQEVVERARAGDERAREVLTAMSYQTGRWIGGAAAVLHGAVDAIILTGGIAFNTPVTDYITGMVSFIAPVVVIPGEDELEALAACALRLLTGETTARNYTDSIL